MTDDDPPAQHVAESSRGEHVDRESRAKHAGDEVLERALGAMSDPVELRFARAFTALHIAMPPEFGPANAWLFHERGRRLDALARALKIADRSMFESLAMDAFVTAVATIEAALANAGYAVTQDEVTTSSLGWAPLFVGRGLRVVDARRTIEHGAAQVHPEVALSLFPHGHFTVMVKRTARAQAASLVAATQAALIACRTAPPTTDRDDGSLLAAVLALIAPDAEHGIGVHARLREDGDATTRIEPV